MHRDLYAFPSDDELDLDSEFDSDEDLDDLYEQQDLPDEDSIKSDREDEEKEDSDKELLLAEAREEIEKKLKEDITPKVMKAGKLEPKTPKEEDKVVQKRHITRSTPSSTPTSTPNKRRKL